MSAARFAPHRRKIHEGMARNPGQRKPLYIRLEQAARARRGMREPQVDPIASWMKEAERLQQSVESQNISTGGPGTFDPKPPKRPGFLRKMFQRKAI